MIKLIKSENLKFLKKWNYEKINIVYLDPPYNTKNSGLTFQDNFTNETWSIFFEERLLAIKNIMEKNSVIFTSIGSQELGNAIILLQKVFGKSSMLSIMPRITFKGHKTSNTIINCNDFLIINKIGKIEFNGLDINEKVYNLFDEFEKSRGKFYIRRLDYNSFKYSNIMDFQIFFENDFFYPGNTTNNKNSFNKRKQNNIDGKDWCWIWSNKKVNFAIENGFLYKKNGFLYKKTYTKCEIQKDESGNYFIKYNDRNAKINSLFLANDAFMNSNKYDDIEKLFSYPKPINLIDEILSWPKIKQKKILDPFAGIGTTGIIGNKKGYDVYLIQKSEKIKKGSKAYNMGYRDIFDITKENFKQNNMKVEIVE